MVMKNLVITSARQKELVKCSNKDVVPYQIVHNIASRNRKLTEQIAEFMII